MLLRHGSSLALMALVSTALNGSDEFEEVDPEEDWKTWTERRPEMKLHYAALLDPARDGPDAVACILRAVLDRNGVQVNRVTPEELPLVDGRCSPFGWCLVEEGKDCRPKSWSYPTRPCEALNATPTQRALYSKRFSPRAAIASDMKSTVGDAMNEA